MLMLCRAACIELEETFGIYQEQSFCVQADEYLTCHIHFGLSSSLLTSTD